MSHRTSNDYSIIHLVAKNANLTIRGIIVKQTDCFDFESKSDILFRKKYH